MTVVMGSQEQPQTQFADRFQRIDVDPMTLRVIGGALSAIAKEMGVVIFRTAFNAIIREAEDVGAGIYDADGQELAESETTAMHCGSIPGYIHGILRKHGEDVEAGDVFIHNYPHNGATHSADVGIDSELPEAPPAATGNDGEGDSEPAAEDSPDKASN